VNRLAKHLYVIFIYLFFYLPIAVVVALSFNQASRSLLWKGFSWHWYSELFHNVSLLMVAGNSLIIGVLAATVATVIGTIAAVSLFRYRFFGKKLIHGLLFTLIILPEIVMGISLLLMYSVFNLPLGFWSMLLAHITLCMPFAAVTIYSRITVLNYDIFEAARDLGATDFTTFKKIIIPLLLPGIIAGWLLSFTLSLDDVITSYFVSGPGFEILPLRIYSMVKLGIKPEVNALCTLMLVVTLILVVTAQLCLHKSSKEKTC
jgi:spermidine/putrescine transport system permease protein